MNQENDVDQAPAFQVVKGELSTDELAALSAVLLAAASGSEDTEDTPVASSRTWVRRAVLRLAPKPGPGAWRRSGWR